MNDDFVPVQLDATELVAEARQKQKDSHAREKKRLTTAVKLFKALLKDLAERASLPIGTQLRASISSIGNLTIIVSELDSFHDVTEILAVLKDHDPRKYDDATFDDDVPNRQRRYSYYVSLGEYAWASVELLAHLGEEAQGCKVLKGYETVRRYKEVDYETYSEVLKFVCPGEPGYDDI